MISARRGFAFRTGSKFGAKKVEIDGHKFPSMREAKRYEELKALSFAGEIYGLELQPRFPLRVNEKLVCTYIADFRYRDAENIVHVEDVKSKFTAKLPVYRIKKKLLAALHGIEIEEV